MDCLLQSSSNLHFVISKIMTLQLENLGNFYIKQNVNGNIKYINGAGRIIIRRNTVKFK